MPKEDRGLLKCKFKKKPGPADYSPDFKKIIKKGQQFKMTAASRDIPFAKYNSVHSELIAKGL